MDFEELLSKLSNPAKRALDNEGIHSYEEMASYSQKELLKLHGFGLKSLPIAEHALASVGLKLRE